MALLTSMMVALTGADLKLSWFERDKFTMLSSKLVSLILSSDYYLADALF